MRIRALTAGGEHLGPGFRDVRVGAALDRCPPQLGEHAAGEPKGVEHLQAAAVGRGLPGVAQHVGLRAGHDLPPVPVQHGRDHHGRGLARLGETAGDRRGLDRAVDALSGRHRLPQPHTQLFRPQVAGRRAGRQLGAQRRCPGEQALGRQSALLPGRRHPGCVPRPPQQDGRRRRGGPAEGQRRQDDGQPQGQPAGRPPVRGRPGCGRVARVGEQAGQSAEPARVRPAAAGDQVGQVPGQPGRPRQHQRRAADHGAHRPGPAGFGRGDLPAARPRVRRRRSAEEVPYHAVSTARPCSSRSSHSSSVMSSMPAITFIRESVYTSGCSTDDSRCLTTAVWSPIFHRATPTMR